MNTWQYRRSYRGPLRAAILDWAGTVIDFGCLAPVATFMRAFEEMGVPISVAEARAPMGKAKWDHIRAIADVPRVAEAWAAAHGKAPADVDVDRLYERFLPLQVASVGEHAALIPGAIEAVGLMRARGMRIGSTSGYPRVVMAEVVRLAAEQGYAADSVVASEDTAVGRPSPLPALKALLDLAVWPVEAVVKIGDTVVDIEEGLNGGMWSVGVVVSGNGVGLSLAEWQALPPDEQAARRAQAAGVLAAAGAHYVIDTIADIAAVLDDIEGRLGRGEKP